MNNGTFPELIINSVREEWRASHEKKCFYHERLLYQYLLKKIEGWSVSDFLNEQEIEKYALYAVSDFTSLFCKDLEINRKEIDQKTICDKNAKQFCQGFEGWNVIEPEELMNRYRSGSVKKIIVMSVLHENEIIEELIKRNVLLDDIISFVSVLYS